VLHHDPDMTATADCDRPIEQMTLAEFHATELLDGQRGVSFAEFIDRYAACQWILDIKPESASRTLLLLKKWAVKQAAEDWLLDQARFLTWRRQDAKLLQRLFPNAETLATQSECRRAGIAVVMGLPLLGGIRPGRTYALPPRIAGKELYEAGIFQAYQRRGARVLAFLPQGDEDVERAIEAGADELLLDGVPGSW
jgi:glycerophosphoryl diester phosphodiesterase